MSDEKIIKPDASFKLTEQQLEQIAPLLEKREKINSGMILGSVGLSGKTVALSFIPQQVALSIIDLAYQKLGEKTDVNG